MTATNRGVLRGRTYDDRLGPKRRFAQKSAELRRFTPSPGNSSIGGRRKQLKTKDFRRKPRSFAIGVRHLRSVTFSAALAKSRIGKVNRKQFIVSAERTRDVTWVAFQCWHVNAGCMHIFGLESGKLSLGALYRWWIAIPAGWMDAFRIIFPPFILLIFLNLGQKDTS